MALITRISRLFTADLHAVLDRIEEPEVLLRQAIREMEEELASNEQRIKWLEHELEQLVTREVEIAQSLIQMDEELDVCFDSGKDDLARTLIKRKLEAQRLSKGLVSKIKATEKTLESQRVSFEENRGRLESMRQKAELLTEEVRSSSPGDEPVWSATEFSVGDDEVEVAFLREKQKRSST